MMSRSSILDSERLKSHFRHSEVQASKFLELQMCISTNIVKANIYRTLSFPHQISPPPAMPFSAPIYAFEKYKYKMDSKTISKSDSTTKSKAPTKPTPQMEPPPNASSNSPTNPTDNCPRCSAPVFLGACLKCSYNTGAGL